MAEMKVVHHIKDGAKEMYVIDANHAVANFPKEWSNEPWGNGKSKSTAPVENVVVPNDWKDLAAKDRIALARSLGATGTLSGDTANEAIQAYVDENKADEA